MVYGFQLKKHWKSEMTQTLKPYKQSVKYMSVSQIGPVDIMRNSSVVVPILSETANMLLSWTKVLAFNCCIIFMSILSRLKVCKVCIFNSLCNNVWKCKNSVTSPCCIFKDYLGTSRNIPKNKIIISYCVKHTDYFALAWLILLAKYACHLFIKIIYFLFFNKPSENLKQAKWCSEMLAYDLEARYFW